MNRPRHITQRGLWALVFTGYACLFGLLFTCPQWTAVEKQRIESDERLQLVRALAAAVAQARQIETRKAVVELNDRRADGTFFNPPHPGTGEAAVSVRRVFTTASGLEYSGSEFEIRNRKAEMGNRNAD